MIWLLILFLGFVKCENSNDIEHTIERYFQSESLKTFRTEWDLHRKPLEHAIATALKETVGVSGLNVYIRRTKENLAMGYFHDDNQVKLILKNLNLEDLPRLWMPEVQFSLTSNALKIQSALSKMIIHAEYALVRNKSDIIFDANAQNPYKSSPFLFQQVFDYGKIAITMNGCVLLGLVTTSLNGESINVGYQQFKLINCAFTVEIYKPGAGSPPVIASYVPYRNGDGLGITQLVMKKINNELVPKLQAAVFTFVNTTATFSDHLEKYRLNQEALFRSSSQFLRELVRNINRITIQTNRGIIELEDFTLHWDDGRDKPKGSNGVGETLTLSEMVVTGLDTLYSSHTGGPYKLDTLMIGEEIRLSTLQVRGSLSLESEFEVNYPFSAEITDMAIDLQLIIDEESTDSNKRGTSEVKLKKVSVTGYRGMAFMVPTIVYGSAETLISGYLLNEIPKAITIYLRDAIPKALAPFRKHIEENEVTKCHCDGAKAEDGQGNGHSNAEDNLPEIHELDDKFVQEKMRSLKSQGVKRFKSFKNLRRRNHKTY